MADDDLDYHLVVKCALEEIGFRGMFQSVKNGRELMDYLSRRGKYKCSLTPDLIILDLNMPEKDGRSALHEIRSDPFLRRIPVAVLTTSNNERDIELCRRFRKCSYTRKPTTFEDWIRCVEEIVNSHLPSWNTTIPVHEEGVEFCES